MESVTNVINTIAFALKRVEEIKTEKLMAVEEEKIHLSDHMHRAAIERTLKARPAEELEEAIRELAIQSIGDFRRPDGLMIDEIFVEPESYTKAVKEQKERQEKARAANKAVTDKIQIIVDDLTLGILATKKAINLAAGVPSAKELFEKQA